MPDNFFPKRPEIKPTIYAYELIGVETHKDLIKVGYTDRDAKTRIAEQLKTSNVQYKILLEEAAVKNDGSFFNDHIVHRALRRKNIINSQGEWFKCGVKDVKAAILAIRENKNFDLDRTQNFKMRPEQQEAVKKTAGYFDKEDKKTLNPTHFLWNCKMRFGKTFASYQLAKKMNWKRILVLTFKPAVQSAWEEDLKTHVDFEEWQFISRQDMQGGVITIDKDKPLVCFGSFQDYTVKKQRNNWAFKINWDCIFLDEYHYGAWHDENKQFTGAIEDLDEDGKTDFDEESFVLKSKHYLYLSGTPFKALANGEFLEDQIYNWTYSDEQRAKEHWKSDNNPYLSLPRIVMLTYKIPDYLEQVAAGGEYDEFDLNEFFKADCKKNEHEKPIYDTAEFKHKDAVQKWLNLIRGALQETTTDNLKLGAKKPPMPFDDARLLNILTHTLWFLPDIASCYAMSKLLKEKQNTVYSDYKVIVCAGIEAGIGKEALPPVFAAMDNPLKTKTITLTCGKLTTGVTIKPWSGIFMLRNLTSPETYFQSAFRIQSPWTIKNLDGKSPNKETILKEECYIFDFALNRALRQVSDYAGKLDISQNNPETKVAEFIKFLPVLSYDGYSMTQIDAGGVLDMAMAGTTATLLARRWESALLVNVDNFTLQRILDDKKAYEAVMSIEGFRSLGNNVLETIINNSNQIKKLTKKSSDKGLNQKEKQKLTDAQTEFKSKRKDVQEKLIKFSTRIPVFMYLTDYREQTLRDVITKIESDLFKKVTGLKISDFELLTNIGVFNSALRNDAVYKFRRYEDASLEYAGGMDKHNSDNIGLYDTVIKKDTPIFVSEN